MYASTPDAGRVANGSSPLLLQSLALVAGGKDPGRRGTPLAVSVALHSGLALAVVLVPLLAYDALPTQDVVSSFFPGPLEIPAPPPPPPPPPPGHRRLPRQEPPSAAPHHVLVAPADVSSQITPDSIDFGPARDEGGVEGGVPDGLVGGIVTGLPPAAPPPPAQVVRISSLAAPRLVRKLAPIYPDLAVAARVSGVVVVEAQVDPRGDVTSVRVLSGHPLLERAAVEAVDQWRYQPLLLSGVPTAFIVTVSITFTLNQR